MSEVDPGYGPPPGNPTGPARGGGIPFSELAKANQLIKSYDDAAGNPLLQGTIDPTKGLDRAIATSIVPDIPLVTIQNTWSIEQARSAIYAHLIGIFYSSAQLCESILGDDRVTACLSSMHTALFGREVRLKPAQGRAKGSKAAQECADAWAAWWPNMFDSSFRMLDDYASLMGFSHAQIIWSTERSDLDFAPTLRPWFPQFQYYDWELRRYMAMASNGTFAIVAGGGKWLEHAPFGSYRGWIRGGLRPVTEPWMLRHFGFRDMARFGEVHGNPTRVGYVPIMGDPTERQLFEQAIAGLGANTGMTIPRGINETDQTGYGYELVEAQSSAWEVHPAQIDRCDMAIVLALMMQNLTTEVDGGSYGAAKVHMDVRQGGTQYRNQAWRTTVYSQLARPFAYLNYGDADLAPMTDWDVVGNDEYERNADQWNKAATGLNQFAQSGVRFTDPLEVQEWIGETFGLRKFPAFTLTEPKVAGVGFGGDSKPGGGNDKPKPKT